MEPVLPAIRKSSVSLNHATKPILSLNSPAYFSLNVWSPWFSKGSLSSPGDILCKKIREESHPSEFLLLYLFQDTCKRGCGFIGSDKLSQEMCGRSEVTPACLHISSEFCSSVSVETSSTKSPNPGNGSATFQECFSIRPFLIVLPISQLWPLPFSFKPPFHHCLGCSLTAILLQCLEESYPILTLLLKFSSCFYFHSWIFDCCSLHLLDLIFCH